MLGGVENCWRRICCSLRTVCVGSDFSNDCSQLICSCAVPDGTIAPRVVATAASRASKESRWVQAPLAFVPPNAAFPLPSDGADCGERAGVEFSEAVNDLGGCRVRRVEMVVGQDRSSDVCDGAGFVVIGDSRGPSLDIFEVRRK